MSKSNGFREELQEIVAGKTLVNHPIYVDWAKGDLSRESMSGFMCEEYHYISKAYPILFMIASKAPEDVIEMEIENYHDEMNPDRSHPEILLRFIEASGTDLKELKKGRGLYATQAWVSWLYDLAENEPWQAVLTAMHVGSEFQAVGCYTAILPALREKYKFTEHEIEHFWLHAVADVEHGGTALDVLERHCKSSESKDIVKHYLQEAVNRRWFVHDCAYLHYEKGLI